MFIVILSGASVKWCPPTVWGEGIPTGHHLSVHMFFQVGIFRVYVFEKLGHNGRNHENFIPSPSCSAPGEFLLHENQFSLSSVMRKNIALPLVPDSRETGTFWIKVGWMSGCNLCFWFLALAFQSFRNFFMDPSQMSERSHMKWFITVYLLVFFATWSRIKKV